MLTVFLKKIVCVKLNDKKINWEKGVYIGLKDKNDFLYTNKSNEDNPKTNPTALKRTPSNSAEKWFEIINSNPYVISN